jgi:ATP-binding cassette, subfamily B (MDR/TAP), member 1
MNSALLVVGQTLSGIRVTTAFPSVLEAMTSEFVHRLEAPLTLVTKFIPRDSAIYGITQMFLIWIIAFAFWYGSRLIAAGQFDVGG